MAKKFLTWIAANEKTILWLAILLYLIVFSAVCLWKYSIFAYNGLDLAIFNNVFWQTVHGQPFVQSIHPHSYLGDHAGFGLLILAPIYAWFQDPRTLLILQTLALALTAWPIYLLAKTQTILQHSSSAEKLTAATCWKKSFSATDKKWRKIFPLIIALAWLLNPLVQNINLFEFHLLPFALPPLFFMLLAYEKNQRWRFVLLAAVAMIFREDVALVMAAVGLLAVLEKKSWWWRLTPIVFGAAWFLTATRVIAHFAPNNSYKFLIYYSWLIETPGNLFNHLLTLGNLEMLLGFGLPLLFLPGLAPKKLILALGPLLQILLSAPGGSSIVIQTHYAVLFLPAIFLAAMTAINNIAVTKKENKNRPRGVFRSTALLGMILLSSIYGALALGPLPTALTRLTSGDGQTTKHTAQQILSLIPEDAAVVASYELLPHLSSRAQIFSAHYVFLGVEQFATGSYQPPTDQPLWLAFADHDLFTYRTQFLKIAWARPYYVGGRERLSALVGQLITRAGHHSVYGPLQSSLAMSPPFNQPLEPRPKPLFFADGTSINAYQTEIKPDRLLIQLDLTLGREPNEAKILTFTLFDAAGKQLKIESPLINDLHQPINAGATYEFVADFPLQKKLTGENSISVELKTLEATQILDALGSTVAHFDQETNLGKFELD